MTRILVLCHGDFLPHNAELVFYGFRCVPGPVESLLENHLQCRVTLFRRDNMKSVCVLDQADADDCTILDDDPEKKQAQFWNNNVPSKLNSTRSGDRARYMLNEKYGVQKMNVSADLATRVVLPRRGDDDEPAWLRNARQAVDDDELYTPDQADRAELSKIPSFNYELVTGSTVGLSVGDDFALFE